MIDEKYMKIEGNVLDGCVSLPRLPVLDILMPWIMFRKEGDNFVSKSDTPTIMNKRVDTLPLLMMTKFSALCNRPGQDKCLQHESGVRILGNDYTAVMKPSRRQR